MADTSPGTEQAYRFSSPQEEAMLSLIRTADYVQRDMHRRLKPFGLTPTQFNVLRILRGASPAGLTCSAIGRSMLTPEPDITRLLSRLKTQKLLCQQRDRHDRRIVWTCITPEGKDLLARLDDTVDQMPKELMRGLSENELRELTRLMQKARSRCAGTSIESGRESTEDLNPRQATAKKLHSPPSPRLPHRPE